jgi:glucosamine--fructose-6-phosphate aminotransferase (isomerizing)
LKESLAAQLENVPRKIQQIIDTQEKIAHCAERVSKSDQVFFIAKGVNVPIALEGALKVKEIAYLQAEGYSAGELKHGPFALLTPSTTVVVIVPKDENHSSLTTTVQEIQARKAQIVCIVDEDDDTFDDSVDCVLKIPSSIGLVSPILNTVVLQLLAYYVAKSRGCPIDFPRNLAKSVTVE